MPPDSVLDPRKRDFAVAVGVNSYANDIPHLKGCVNDVRHFRQWLLSADGGGLPEAHVTTICTPDPLPPQYGPKQEDVEDALLPFFTKFIETGEKVGRRLYLWFSGHGVSPESDAEDCALLMANVTPPSLRRAILGKSHAEAFRRAAIFEEVVLVMDCCREVAGRCNASRLLNFGLDESVGEDIPYLYAFATGASKTSLEAVLPHPFLPGQPNYPVRQGVFSHLFLEGLTRGTDEAGRVTSASLRAYVNSRMQKHPDAKNQLPKFVPFEASIDFGAGRPFDVTVDLTDPAAGLRVLGPPDGFTPVAVEPTPRPGGLAVRLPPGFYQFGVPHPGGGFARSKLVRVMSGEPLHVAL